MTLSWSSSSRHDRRWLDRVAFRAAALGVLADTVLLALSPSPRDGSAPLWLVGSCLTALAISGALVLLGATRSGPRSLLAVPWIAVSAVTDMALALSSDPTRASSGTPWSLHPTASAICLAVAVLPEVWAATAASVLVVCLTALRWRLQGPAPAVADCVTLSVGAASVLMVVELFRRRVAELDTVLTHSVKAEVASRVATATLAEKVWWDSLIHDKVLGALLVGSRATTGYLVGTARSLARDALSTLSERGSGQDDEDCASVVDTLNRAAQQEGLLVTVVGTEPRLPVPVVRALSDAACQALVNVARHSGVHEATVTFRSDGDEVTLVVEDRGCGFDPSVVDLDRLGTRVSIPSHMARVRGRTDVRSRPGVGTRVTLSWSPGPSALPGAVASPPLWSRHSLGPFRLFATLWVASQVIGAWETREAVLDPALWWLGAVLVVIAVATLAVRGTAAASLLAAASVPSGVLALSLSLDLSGDTDGRWWFAGAGVPVVLGLVALGHRRASWWVSWTSFFLAVTVAAGKQGGAAAVPAAEAMLQLPLFSLIGTVLSSQLTVLTEERRATEERLGELEAADLITRALVNESVRRGLQLEQAAVPLLHQLLRGQPLSPTERRGLAEAESELRDQLLAETLLDHSVVVATREARRRGVRVVLLDTRERGHAGLAPAEIRSALRVVLDRAGPTSTVTCRVSQDEDVTRISLSGTELTSLPTAQQVRRPLRLLADSDLDLARWEWTAPLPTTPYDGSRQPSSA